eukprot:CAMPEP_0114546024 /NCGR_PEP_ID=MMETSP0114-20121206/3720_1 /TAXON_ID=31324 /ORGANISM="Goniomonas sp, Strain m" /LENGTH=140 /DNA_ID=CAMNT_0001730505 /DNA_START=41 /DNA_END=463 /DNA_ORIENTATION=+
MNANSETSQTQDCASACLERTTVPVCEPAATEGGLRRSASSTWVVVGGLAPDREEEVDVDCSSRQDEAHPSPIDDENTWVRLGHNGEEQTGPVDPYRRALLRCFSSGATCNSPTASNCRPNACSHNMLRKEGAKRVPGAC